MSVAVGVAGLGLWMPGYPDVARWVAGERDAEEPRPQGRALDRMNRRRASILGRALADALAEAVEQSGVDASAVPTLVGSSIAEASTMVGLLEQIWRRNDPVSPAAFTVSVHNAASGLISISAKNQGYASSLAADEDTPAVTLLEAIGLVATTGEPVALVCGDEPVPLDLVPEERSWPLQAAGAVLAPLDGDVPLLASLSVELDGEADLERAELDEATARNPVAGMVDLVNAAARGWRGRLRLDRGAGRGYVAVLGEAPAR